MLLFFPNLIVFYSLAKKTPIFRGKYIFENKITILYTFYFPSFPNLKRIKSYAENTNSFLHKNPILVNISEIWFFSFAFCGNFAIICWWKIFKLKMGQPWNSQVYVRKRAQVNPGWKTVKFCEILYVTEHFLNDFGWFI